MLYFCIVKFFMGYFLRKDPYSPLLYVALCACAAAFGAGEPVRRRYRATASIIGKRLRRKQGIRSGWFTDLYKKTVGWMFFAVDSSVVKAVVVPFFLLQVFVLLSDGSSVFFVRSVLCSSTFSFVCVYLSGCGLVRAYGSFIESRNTRRLSGPMLKSRSATLRLGRKPSRPAKT